MKIVEEYLKYNAKSVEVHLTLTQGTPVKYSLDTPDGMNEEQTIDLLERFIDLYHRGLIGEC